MRATGQFAPIITGVIAASFMFSSTLAVARADPPATWAKLLAPDGVANDLFGISASVSGSTIAIGSEHHDALGMTSGSVYVFDRTSTGAWAFTRKLLPASGGVNDSFGRHVILQADRLYVTASADDEKASDAGAVYVLEHSSGTWAQVAKLMASDGTGGDDLGDAIAVDGDRMLAGAPHDDETAPFAGSAYVFERSPAGGWGQKAKLLPSDGSMNDSFGAAVAIEGDIAVIGASSDDVDGSGGYPEGSAYVFRRTPAGTWAQHQKITASDGDNYDYFGSSVSIHNGWIVVGATHDGDAAPEAGSAYVFRYDASSDFWVQDAKLTASDVGTNDWMGTSVLMTDGRIWVGAEGSEWTLGQTGAVYLFERDPGSGVWHEALKLVPSDASAGDLFGRRLTLDGDLLVVPSVYDDDQGIDSGSAYVIDLTPSFIAYGFGCPGSGGISPQLALTGSATPGGQVQVSITNGVGSGTALIFLGAQQAAIPMGYGCTLNVSPVLPLIVGPIPLFPFGAQGAGAGSISFPGNIPPSVIPPVTITLQAFVADPGGLGGFSNTNGVEMNIH